ncbi:MAG: hypothetical protein E6K98_03330 [Thaumarchaeota archaeon]|nr:MAG: hypothetical protein E6K98_03330 [Nitrososphaerota archaeon]
MILGNTQTSTDELFLYTFIHEKVNLFNPHLVMCNLWQNYFDVSQAAGVYVITNEYDVKG